MKALVLGATGLVGAQLVRQLLANPAYESVRLLARRAPSERPQAPGGPTSARTGRQPDVRVVDFEQLAAAATAPPAHSPAQELFAGIDHVYCALGTTIRQAGSQAAFRRVDHDYVIACARMAAQAGVRKLLLVSSIGADASSRTFYLRVKGETEAAVAASGVPETHVFRPSFLLGKRPGARPLEQLSIALVRPLAPLMAGPLRPYRPVEAAEVARRMIAEAITPGAHPGHHVHDFR